MSLYAAERNSLSTPMPSNPVIHKLTLLPKRRLFVGSYLFQVSGGACNDRTMCAISLLGDYLRLVCHFIFFKFFL